MFPPSQGLRLDIDAISQICGSVSIACWIVVFSPQILENWRRSSAEGLSVVFITVWLLGDFFNIFGAVLQGVLPTMTILAVYYTLADIVLLGQYFWYEGFRLTDPVNSRDGSSEDDDDEAAEASERSPLLTPTLRDRHDLPSNGFHTPPRISDADGRRRGSAHSNNSFRERFLSVSSTHLSPANPLLDEDSSAPNKPTPRPQPTSALQAILFNASIILLVCASGVFGWWLSTTRSQPPPSAEQPHETPQFNLWGQIFGYICAVLYLGSRIPQLLLNYRRKSTDGISMLFFLFACIGNLTYVLSIVAYKPVCRKPNHCREGEAMTIYGRYILVNLSWLLGSFGTLLLDAGVFIQYFLYRKDDESDSDEEEGDEE